MYFKLYVGPRLIHAPIPVVRLIAGHSCLSSRVVSVVVTISNHLSLRRHFLFTLIKKRSFSFFFKCYPCLSLDRCTNVHIVAKHKIQMPLLSSYLAVNSRFERIICYVYSAR